MSYMPERTNIYVLTDAHIAFCHSVLFLVSVVAIPFATFLGEQDIGL